SRDWSSDVCSSDLRKSRIASRRLERSLLSCALAGCMLLSAPALAQSTGATLRGKVDSGATVTVTNVDTGLTRTVRSAEGNYAVTGLPPGTYRIDVVVDGQ